MTVVNWFQSITYLRKRFYFKQNKLALFLLLRVPSSPTSLSSLASVSTALLSSPHGSPLVPYPYPWKVSTVRLVTALLAVHLQADNLLLRFLWLFRWTRFSLYSSSWTSESLAFKLGSWIPLLPPVLSQIPVSSDYHIDSVCFKTVSSIFKTGSTLKCRYALGLDFTAITYLYFSVAFYMYI